MTETVIDAVSKYRQTEEVLRKMTKRALGKSFEHFSYQELSGGLCNVVYLIEADQEKMVLKVAPESDVLMMRHEKDIIKTEARMLKLIEEKLHIPAPRLIYFDMTCTVCDVPYLFMSVIEGRPLMNLSPQPEEKAVYEIKREVGEICKQICSIHGDYFGIPSVMETHMDNNCDFILTLFKMLLQDAKEKDIEVPGMEATELLALIESQREVLNEVLHPCLIHTDTWDGNLMVKDDRLMGLIDYAAMLYGDPLMSHDFHDFSPEPGNAFCEGFGKASFTDNEKIRISIYKLWHRLGMIVERGYRNYIDTSLYAWVLDEYTNELDHLMRITAR
ncbi:MAG: aminoglycoside phosphotransferase family protein [bacterium]|nr:aminoglycoside phosphotransferase family protein [bacterium]